MNLITKWIPAQKSSSSKTGIKIRRARELEVRFFKDLESRMNFEDEKRRSEIHVSDLVYCLKKAYFRKKGIKENHDPKELAVKSIGKGHHHIYETLKGAFRELEVRRYGVVGHIDLFEDCPIEIKTTRRKLKEIGKIPEHYLRQVAYYCILTQKTRAFLVYVYVVKPEIKIYELDYSPCLEGYSKEFHFRLNLLRRALKEDRPGILAESNFKWECRYCSFKEVCLK